MNPKKFCFEFLKYEGANTIKDTENCCKSAKLILSLPSSYNYALAYFHSFGVTENYIIFLEQSLLSHFGYMMLRILKNEPLQYSLVKDKSLETKIHLINKHTGQVINKKFVTMPQISFHFINCYEERDESNQLKRIQIDLCSFDVDDFDVDILKYDVWYSDKMLGSGGTRAFARRITVPIEDETPNAQIVACTMKDINTSSHFDFPVINYAKFNGKPYKYTYGVNFYELPFSVVKLNVQTGELLEFKYIPDSEDDILMAGEPIFVDRLPNCPDTDEDDGVVLVMVQSTKHNDFLSIIDAKTFKEVARCEINNVKFSFGFHGFFADNQTHPKLNI